MAARGSDTERLRTSLPISHLGDGWTRNNDEAFVIEAEPKHSLFAGLGNIKMVKTNHMACCGHTMGAQALQNAVFLLGSKICFCGQVGRVKRSNKQRSRWRAAGEGLPGSSRFFLAPHDFSLAPPSTCWLLWKHKSMLT